MSARAHYALYVRIYQVYFVGECQSSLSYLKYYADSKNNICIYRIITYKPSLWSFWFKINTFWSNIWFSWQMVVTSFRQAYFLCQKVCRVQNMRSYWSYSRSFAHFAFWGQKVYTTFGKNMMYMYIYGCPCTSCSTEILGFKCSILIFYLVRSVRLAYHACIKIVHWFQL